METVQTCELCDGRAFSSVLRQRDLLLNYRYPFFQVVRCDSCGLLFTNPRPSREELIAYYPREYYGLFHDLSAPAKQERITTAPSWRQRVKAQLLKQTGKECRTCLTCVVGEVESRHRRRIGKGEQPAGTIPADFGSVPCEKGGAITPPR